MSLHIVLAVMRTQRSAQVSAVSAPSEGITTGTLLPSSFTSVLMVVSVSAPSQVHYTLNSCLLSATIVSSISPSKHDFLLGSRRFFGLLF